MSFDTFSQQIHPEELSEQEVFPPEMFVPELTAEQAAEYSDWSDGIDKLSKEELDKMLDDMFKHTGGA